MDAFSVIDDVIDDYSSFVHGFLHIKDESIKDKVDEEIACGVALNPAFEPGGSIGDLRPHQSSPLQGLDRQTLPGVGARRALRPDPGSAATQQPSLCGAA